MVVADVTSAKRADKKECTKEHKHNLTQGLLEKSNSAQQTYKEGQKTCWEEDVLQTEPNTTYRKYKESVHMFLVAHPISQCTLAISHPMMHKSENYYSTQFRLYGKVTFLCWFYTDTSFI
jgi:hypothetical protein